ncbi:hypothetical protein B296_00019785 [Ensete ventricosum]|uniref:Uncharacterized protein n=1 Tax=Ensete ventricosum TaxID=4639 RepID=A0A426YQ75_ENSVE|nr:hypothetical protein B296_00019785 [Ensete ventricosum]
MEVGDITQRNEPDMIGSRRLCCSLRGSSLPPLLGPTSFNVREGTRAVAPLVGPRHRGPPRCNISKQVHGCGACGRHIDRPTPSFCEILRQMESISRMHSQASSCAPSRRCGGEGIAGLGAVRCGKDGPGKRRRASRADPRPDPVRSVQPFQCSSSERPQRDLNGGVGFCVITASDSVGSRAAQLLQRNMTRGASASSRCVRPVPPLTPTATDKQRVKADTTVDRQTVPPDPWQLTTGPSADRSRRPPEGRSRATTSPNLQRRSSAHGNSHRGDLSSHVAGQPQHFGARRKAYVVRSHLKSLPQSGDRGSSLAYFRPHGHAPDCGYTLGSPTGDHRWGIVHADP